jgi:chaperone modulatory protein CbpM
MTTGERKSTTLVGTILEEEVVLSIDEVCVASRVSTQRIVELAQEGIIEPIGGRPQNWRFRGVDLQRIRCARRLQEDLGVNTPGIALALDLLEELERLRERIGRLET